MATDIGSEVHVDVVAMKRRHLRSVLRIEQQVYPKAWGMSLFLSELALGTMRHYLVARVGRTVVGYAGLLFAGSDAHVTTIAVDPSWQRRGVASRLLVALGRVARARGSGGLTLEVRESNAAAQALYAKFGFTAAGVRKGYYRDSGEDAIIMWAHDVQSSEYGDLLDGLLLDVAGTTAFEALP